MTDQELIKEIDELVDEERPLHEHGVGRGLTDEEQLGSPRSRCASTNCGTSCAVAGPGVGAATTRRRNSSATQTPSSTTSNSFLRSFAACAWRRKLALAALSVCAGCQRSSLFFDEYCDEHAPSASSTLQQSVRQFASLYVAIDPADTSPAERDRLTRPTRYPSRTEVRTVACPTCGAVAGQLCFGAHGCNRGCRTMPNTSTRKASRAERASR